MTSISGVCAPALLVCSLARAAAAAEAPTWPSTLPKYDHILIVVEENKDYEQIIGNKEAPYINMLAAEGANFSRMFGEEPPSEGNHVCLFSVNNQNVGFADQVPSRKFSTSSLGEQLIKKGLSFKGYSEALPAIGSRVDVTTPKCRYPCIYGRKHVPWISFAAIPNGTTIATSSNLRFVDFPSDYTKLPTVAFVIPNMENDMHNGAPKDSVPAGDRGLRHYVDGYYQWAKTHNILLILTFDEDDGETGYSGRTA